MEPQHLSEVRGRANDALLQAVTRVGVDRREMAVPPDAASADHGIRLAVARAKGLSRVGNDDLVRARAGVYVVVAGAPDKAVVASAPEQCVVAVAAIELLTAIVTD